MALSKPLVGIDRPARASEDWKPSISAHIELTRIEINRQKLARIEPALEVGDEPLTRRERSMTPAQWVQIVSVRRKMREFRDSA